MLCTIYLWVSSKNHPLQISSANLNKGHSGGGQTHPALTPQGLAWGLQDGDTKDKVK